MAKCQCPLCKECFEAESEWLGRSVTCPWCEQTITIQPALQKIPRVADYPMPNAMYDQVPDREPKKQKSVASLVLGLCGIVAWIIPLFGLPVTITGLVLGIRKRYAPGIVLNAIFLLFSVVNSILGVILALQGKMFQ